MSIGSSTSQKLQVRNKLIDCIPNSEPLPLKKKPIGSVEG